MSVPNDEQIGEIPLEIKPDLDLELVEEFINDSREQLENIEQGTLALERDAHEPEVLRSLFRAFHTFKGNSGFLDLTPISSLAHMLESLLDAARENRVQITPRTIEIILKGRDTLQKFVDEIEGQISGKRPREVVTIPTAALKAALKFMISHEGAPAAAPATAPAPQGATPTAIPVLAEDDEHLEATPRTGGYVKGAALQVVKVSTAKLDGLVDLSGELLIAQSLIAQGALSHNVDRHTMARNIDQLTRICKELQRTAMSMRMVPIRATLQKMQRLARDIAAREKKNVQLILEGEETEVDRTVAEKLSDPLMHMIANAVDHGLETPDERVAKGKPSTGTIRIHAYHKSGNIVIEVGDDGRGLNRERILDRAIKLGLVRPGSPPDEKELYALILQSGFSTATTVTTISGRGVGMDVVHKNVAALRGRIDIKSTPGHGTTFTLRLPLTLAIIDGMIIGVGGQRYILPASCVRESFQTKAGMISCLPGEHEVVEIRKEVLPLLRLRHHFGLTAPTNSRSDGVLVVIESDGKKRCLMADELVGKQEVVIKNLGEVFKTDPMVAGGAILGDGCVGVILDPGALVHLEHVPDPKLTLARTSTMSR
jgi:two-component system chemotaxis sensor kinase CheA